MKFVERPTSERRLRMVLSARGCSFEPHEHAFWRSRIGDITVIFYRNGTLLLQGPDDRAAAVAADLGLGQPVEPKAQERIEVKGAVLGLDESGKGDYFGPIVLAAVIADESDPRLEAMGIKDSKLLTGAAVEKAFNALKDSLTWKVRVIEPSEYNRLYHEKGNLNWLMVDEYAALIASFDASLYTHAVLDRFSQSDEQNGRVRKSCPHPMTIVERGERNAAVAAASVVARHHFTSWMEESRQKSGLMLPLGSGPQAGALFRELREKLPSLEFEALAKAHFSC